MMKLALLLSLFLAPSLVWALGPSIDMNQFGTQGCEGKQDPRASCEQKINRDAMPAECAALQNDGGLRMQGVQAVSSAVSSCKERVWNQAMQACEQEMALRIGHFSANCFAQSMLNGSNQNALDRSSNFLSAAMACKQKQDMNCAMAFMKMAEDASKQAGEAFGSFMDSLLREQMKELENYNSGVETVDGSTPSTNSQQNNANETSSQSDSNHDVAPTVENVNNENSSEGNSPENIAGPGTFGTGPGSENGLAVTPELAQQVAQADAAALQEALKNGSLYDTLSSGKLPAGTEEGRRARTIAALQKAGVSYQESSGAPAKAGAANSAGMSLQNKLLKNNTNTALSRGLWGNEKNKPSTSAHVLTHVDGMSSNFLFERISLHFKAKQRAGYFK